MAIRRSPSFRFDYFLKSLPTELIGRRCEQLMKAAEKEVEQLEKKIREDSGLISEVGKKSGEVGIEIPSFKVLSAKWRRKEQDEAEKKRIELEAKVIEIEESMREIQGRMKMLNQYTREANINITLSSAEFTEDLLTELANLVAQSGSLGIVGVANKFLEHHSGSISRRKVVAKIEEIAQKEKREDEGDTHTIWYLRSKYTHLLDVDTTKALRQSKEEKLKQMEEHNQKSMKQDDPCNVTGALGPDGTLLEFPDYDGDDEPQPCKKAFTLFCGSVRKQVKSALPPEKRKNKEIVHRILRERWSLLSDEEQMYWTQMETWGEKRFARDEAIYIKVQAEKKQAHQNARNRTSYGDADNTSTMSIPKKRKSPSHK
jgi:SLIDE